MTKRILFTPKDKEYEPPDGLEVALPLEELGVLLIKTKSYEK